MAQCHIPYFSWNTVDEFWFINFKTVLTQILNGISCIFIQVGDIAYPMQQSTNGTAGLKWEKPSIIVTFLASVNLQLKQNNFHQVPLAMIGS